MPPAPEGSEGAPPSAMMIQAQSLKAVLGNLHEDDEGTPRSSSVSQSRSGVLSFESSSHEREREREKMKTNVSAQARLFDDATDGREARQPLRELPHRHQGTHQRPTRGAICDSRWCLRLVETSLEAL